MKLSLRIISFFIIIIGLLFSGANHTQVVFASKNPTISALTPTPLPVPIQTSLEATATVDPASIGDTSGVIAIGMIVVFIILAGIVWGSLELRQESRKTRQPKE
jgi:hypothetical protein